MSDTSVRGKAGQWPVWAAVAVAVVFVLMALPLTVWQLMSQSDEARYTVAAARMMESGDYIVPYSAWGEVRFLKPPLTYYYVVAGFTLFGQSVFGAKVFWLVSGTVVLWLTWAMARVAGATRIGAAVAVAALAGNIVFFRGSLTHNPDMPLVLGISVSLLGFARIVRDDNPPAWAYYAAWIGVGWAFFAKGLLAVLLVVLALAVRAVAQGVGRPGRHEILAIVLAAVLAGWWYVVVALRDPSTFLTQFIGDQVTRKVIMGPAMVLGRFAANTAGMLLGFLPFLLAGVPLLRRGARLSWPAILLALWVVFVVVLFSFSMLQETRYMLPGLPALAALIGLAFGSEDDEVLARKFGRALRICLVLTVLVGLMTATVVQAGAPILWAIALLLAVLGVVWLLWRVAGSGRVVPNLVLLSMILPATVLSAFPAIKVAGLPAAADHAAAAIRASGLPTHEVAISGKWRFLDRVGLSAPPIQGYRYSNKLRDEMLDGAGMFVTIDADEAAEVEALGWTVRSEIGAPEDFTAQELLDAIRTRDIAGLRETYGEKVYIATPGPGE